MCGAKLCTLHFVYNNEGSTRHIFRTLAVKKTRGNRGKLGKLTSGADVS